MDIKTYEKIRSALLEQIKIENYDSSATHEALIKIEELLIPALDLENIILTRRKFDELIKNYYDDIFGLGPIEDLLADPSVNDIMVNGCKSIYIERAGKLIKQDSQFKSNEQILRIAQRIVAPIGRRVDESSPMVDARLADGSRVNIIIPPVALDGCTISIRKFKEDKLDLIDLINFGSMSEAMGHYLSLMVRAKANIIISGGRVQGKPPCSMRFPMKSMTATASSPSKMPPSCSCKKITSCAWSHAPKVLTAAARSLFVTW